ncbi:hypothetical protein H257_03844 [Aphanomyces astaci]|uniref:No apical meristem-associated C-terminal domain-containing protein n=1 Tax=Aphanomyces astaci TaxID=112090 RepID=W4H0E5_APHAT|nr:hypothetical protein H257_03844 [Aphanomyces astaci]ETV84739.1 hypothetical protein H257_03844 [Aphanomyces astaci]|eukprot:XP_009826431.1 hypothetical protein H257_03844 [Aphanomyces astaci]
MRPALELYKLRSKKSAFRLHHCWLILKDAPKWSVAMEPQEAGSEPASVTLAPVSAMASMLTVLSRSNPKWSRRSWNAMLLLVTVAN